MEQLSSQSQVSKYHIMVPEYDNSGILSLTNPVKGKTTFESFFKGGKNITRYKKIKFYYKNVDGSIITDIDWVFIDGVDIINSWGAWTNSSKVTLGFIPEDKEFRRLIIKISDVLIDSTEPTLNADIHLNKYQIGSVSFTPPKSKYSFPKIIEFSIPDNLIIKNKPNIFEIYIKSPNTQDNSDLYKDAKDLALGLIELSLE